MLGQTLHQFRMTNDLTLDKVARDADVCIETVRRAEQGNASNDRTKYKLRKFMSEFAKRAA